MPPAARPVSTEPVTHPQPRIAPVSAPTAEVATLLAGTWQHNGAPLNVPLTMAHHPRLLRRFATFAGLFLLKSELPLRDREVLTLRATYRAGTEYYFGHHALMTETSGISPEVLREITTRYGRFDDADALLVAIADELIDNGVLSEPTWDAVRERYTESQAMELVLLPGFYRMVAGFVNTLGIQREPGVPGWPAELSTGVQ
jgi:alkylhydroperoxidase family enzyme